MKGNFDIEDVSEISPRPLDQLMIKLYWAFFTAIQVFMSFLFNLDCIIKKSFQKQAAEVEMLMSVLKAFEYIEVLGVCVCVFVVWWFVFFLKVA